MMGNSPLQLEAVNSHNERISTPKHDVNWKHRLGEDNKNNESTDLNLQKMMPFTLILQTMIVFSRTF